MQLFIRGANRIIAHLWVSCAHFKGGGDHVYICIYIYTYAYTVLLMTVQIISREINEKLITLVTSREKMILVIAERSWELAFPCRFWCLGV